MSPLEPSCPTIAGTDYSSTAEAQEKDLKTACKKELNKSLRKTLTNGVRMWTNHIKKSRKI